MFWKIKVFKTQEALDLFIKRHKHRIQYEVLFIENGFGVEFRALRRVY